MATARKLPSGNWQGRYPDPRGKMRPAGTYPTKREALDAAQAEEAAQRAGRWIDPDLARMTVEAWAPQWRAARSGTEPATEKKIKSYLDARILPKWGQWPLGDITTTAVRGWTNDLTRELAPVTVRNIYSTFHTMMQDAVDDRLLHWNPCTLKRSDLPKRRPSTAQYLTPDEFRMLIALAPGRYSMLLDMAVWTGLRWGEIAALDWNSIDLTGGTVRVHKAAKRNGTIGETKNKQIRSVHLEPSLIVRLSAYRRDFGVGQFVFPAPAGGRLDYSHFRTRVWDPTVKASKLTPAPRFHDLRHTYASLMIQTGMDWIVLADQLGHHSPSFTMDRYGHLRHDSTEVVRAALQRAAAL